MRLLNTTTYEVREFLHMVPTYAILSHTWEQEEVSFRDMLKGPACASKLRGFAKIEGCCRQAQEDGYSWLWVDTCCIDKSSSAELSEAVNSMYSWYQGAAVCYAYLADVPRFSFMDSRWFERGWTLQELIAPRYVEFYSADWLELGTKSSLEPVICSITGIDPDVLRGRSPLTCTVAERMSWAAGRRTTRLEDEAYCLLGLFDINMTLLYGEGLRAFTRLQEEIIRQSEDLSLLAWSPWVERGVHEAAPATGALAPNPSVFKRPDLTSYLPSTAFGFDDAESLLLADMGSLDWRDLHPHQWGSNLELLPLHQFLFEPPTVTSRGISATFLVDLAEMEDSKNMGGDGDTEGAMVDVLAWVYTDVVTRASAGSRAVSRSDSRPRPQSSADRSMMVCIWLSLPRSEVGSFQAPIRAVRLQDKNPVCVPMIFLNRFQPRRLYLQYAPDRPMPSQLQWGAPAQFSGGVPTGGSPSKRIKIRFDEPVASHRLGIVSHYPPQAFLSPPVSETRKQGSLWVAATGSFDVMISGCQAMEASAVLRCSLSGPGVEPRDGQFLVVIGPPRLGEHLNCHVEQLDSGLAALEAGAFWSEYFSTQNRHHELEEARGPPTDRSSLLLPCGIGVAVAIKKRMVEAMGEFLPTLALSTQRDGYKVMGERLKMLRANDHSPGGFGRSP